MANVQTSMLLSDTLGDLSEFKYNPAKIQDIHLSRLESAVNGEINLVDATNPFIYLLEVSTMNTYNAVLDNMLNLRKKFPSLAQTTEDLYNHMCDEDYKNIFSVPATANFIVMVNLTDINQKMVFDNSESCYKAKIPRDTYVTVGGVRFTSTYPIVLRRRVNGVLSVSYETDIQSPVATVDTNIISHDIRADNNGVKWLFFTVPLTQMTVETSSYSVGKSELFKKDITYTDKFYMCRVYQKNKKINSTEWTEMSVTYSDQVYDPFTATATVKVLEGNIVVTIPIVYINTGLVEGSVRVDIYSTKGNVRINMSDFNISSYETTYEILDQRRDSDVYTEAIKDITAFFYSVDRVNGGNGGLSFDELKRRVINNTVGVKKVPITNLQLVDDVKDLGYDLVKNIDTVTNRMMLMVKKLPYPSNPALFTPANISVSSFIYDPNTSSDYISNINSDKTTIKSRAIFQSVNGVTKLLNTSEDSKLNISPRQTLTDKLNNKDIRYVYTPFYYCVNEENGSLNVTAYHLDSPKVMSKSFVFHNQATNLSVATANYKIEKMKYGYRILLVTKSDTFYQQLPDSYVKCQISFTPVNETRKVYINATLLSTTPQSRGAIGGERIYEVRLETNYDLYYDGLVITNAYYTGNSNIPVKMLYDQKIDIIYTTSSIPVNYTMSYLDGIIGSDMLPTGSVGVSFEEMGLSLGSQLQGLYTQSRYLSTNPDYKRYDTDVEAYYEADVYEQDSTGSITHFNPVTGGLEYNIIHKKGDPVLDGKGLPVLLHKKGDVILDNNGKPITLAGSYKPLKEINIVVIDAKYAFCSDTNVVSYTQEVSDIITTWVTTDVKTVQAKLLENTRVYYHPPRHMDRIKVIHGGESIYINSEQTPTVDIYIKRDSFNIPDIVDSIKEAVVKYIDWYLSANSYVNVSEMEKNILDNHNGVLSSISISGLFGDLNVKYISFDDARDRLVLGKKIIDNRTGDLTVIEDVTFNVVKVD